MAENVVFRRIQKPPAKLKHFILSPGRTALKPKRPLYRPQTVVLKAEGNSPYLPRALRALLRCSAASSTSASPAFKAARAYFANSLASCKAPVGRCDEDLAAEADENTRATGGACTGAAAAEEEGVGAAR